MFTTTYHPHRHSSTGIQNYFTSPVTLEWRQYHWRVLKFGVDGTGCGGGGAGPAVPERVRRCTTCEAQEAATGRGWEARFSEERRICRGGGEREACDHGSRCQDRQARPSHQVSQSQSGREARCRCSEPGYRRRRTEPSYESSFIALWHSFQSAS